MNIRHIMAQGIDSPIWDRLALTVGRTAADDLAELGAGDGLDDGDGSDEGTLLGDMKEFDLEEGYSDEMPAELAAEAEEETHDYRQRHRDTRAALDRERAEKAALQAQLATLQQQRTQPAQPNVIQAGQPDPLAHIEQHYASEKDRLKAQTMNTIRAFNRNDPMIQDKIANAWAKHSEDVAELALNVSEQRRQVKTRQEQDIEAYRDNQAARALQAAGYDPKSDREAFVERVVLLNHRTPGWERGMSDAETYDYVVKQMREGGHVSANPERLTPRQQHEALRNTGRTAVKPGARQDPTNPKKKALPEEKDVSFHEQMRQLKRKRTVTEDQAMRMKMR